MIAAEGEQKASKSLAAASDVMAESGSVISTYLNVFIFYQNNITFNIHTVFICNMHIFLFRSALQLRYLQTLSSISAEKNSTIIFPLPLDLIRNQINI